MPVSIASQSLDRQSMCRDISNGACAGNTLPETLKITSIAAPPQADGASAGQAMSIASFSDLMSRDESGDLADYRPPRDPLRRAADELLQARTLALTHTPMMTQPEPSLDPYPDSTCGELT